MTVTTPRGANTLNIRPTSTAPVGVVGVLASDSTRPSLHICNMGWAGATAATWADTSAPWSASNFLRAFPHDLAIVNLCINDWNGGAGLPVFRSNYGKIVSALKSVGTRDQILCGGLPSNPAQAGIAPIAVQAQYTKAVQAMADGYRCGFVDFTRRMGSWAEANAIGWTVDALHYTSAAYSDAARSIANPLTNL
ncbi:hypothetical protein BK022_03625 [Methylorubrum extorquens]|uniref:SGNH hydrolase-type esterase domain-containing protein n=1 Tax=Methylorubrum extorquens TaxID=408 RepID=A0A1S1P9B0_METEX|nr:hypothetical protein BK022_03625 [Methylorubrum extorquens]